MRDPRLGLRWSRGRVQRRAQYGGYMDSPEWFRRRERWLEQYRDAHGGQEPVCVVCDAPWTLRGGDCTTEPTRGSEPKRGRISFPCAAITTPRSTP